MAVLWDVLGHVMVPLVEEAADFGSILLCVTMCCETASADAAVIAMGTSLRVWKEHFASGLERLASG